MDFIKYDENIEKELVEKFALNNLLAKSGNEKKTIQSHIEDLIGNLNLFLERLPDLLTEEDKEILKYAILFHDIGKVNNLFQKKLNGRNVTDIIPHNCLSPLFLKKIADKINDQYLPLLTYIIINHHTRGWKYLINERQGIQLLINEINQNQQQFFNGFQFSTETLNLYKDWLQYALNNRKNKKYIALAGLLIRLDHASSGELEVEEKPIEEDRSNLLKTALNIKDFRPFQKKFGIGEKKDCQCIVADTGMGKTGLSVLWSNRKKFYILPNRASVNAMYETLKKVYGDEKVGLLHSTSLYNLLDNYNDDDISVLKQYDQTRVLSKPVTVCTADQLFTAAFNMPGYEKIYATLSYSDVVMDEIQGFQPQQIVPILKQIKETKGLGARYLIITATLPDIVAKRLSDYGFCVVDSDDCTIDNIKRHKIRMEDKKIEELSDEIISKFQNEKKVLIVTNTVRKAQDVYTALNARLSDGEKLRINILHSRFIWKDRQDKEKKVLEETKQDDNGNYLNKDGCIWVCTQLVEASLDLDFDYLFTEASTADSLIQRMGRIWRHRKIDYEGEENIIIATNVEYKVYEKILVEKTIELIKSTIEQNDNYLLSKQKREIVKTLYSEEKLQDVGSNYLDEWKKFENAINSGWNFILEDNAQKAFRDVMTVELIPARYKKEVVKSYNSIKDIYNQINSDPNLSEKDKKDKKRLKRLEILKSIQEYKLPVPIYVIKKIGCSNSIEWLDRDYEIGFLNESYEYNEEIGLTGKAIETEEDDNII